MPDFSARRVVLLAATGLFMIAGLILLGAGLFMISPADKNGPDQVIVIKEGLTLKEVAVELEQRGIIRSQILFRLWTRTMGYSRKIRAGEYLLSPRMPPMKVLEKLTKGIIITHQVTFPEGLTVAEVAELLAKKGLLPKERFLALTEDPSLIQRFGISGRSLEGYLYPDTYQFDRGLTPLTVIETMLHRFWQMVDPLEKRAAEVGMQMGDVVILASIVEKETGRPDERPMIASVFLNRLKRGMRLDSDPTVIYGIKNFNGNLTRQDLEQYTPYNTYQIKGLPPGPIANPGLEAIKAVLYPASTDFLYFVSKKDGFHQFSKTLSQHNEAVQVYQKGPLRPKKPS
jgi:UPF0755 protein